MKTDLKKLTLSQEMLRNLNDHPNDKKRPQATLTGCAPHCLETNCICCHG